jgi:hypothetical protein
LVLDIGESGMAHADLRIPERRIRTPELRCRVPGDGDELRCPPQRRILKTRKGLPSIDPHEEVDKSRASIHEGQRDRKKMGV